MKTKNEIIIPNKNLGIEILRFFLCQWVVLYHYTNKSYINHKYLYFIKSKIYHVPCFTFISFFFTSNLFINKNIQKIKNRFHRLLIPYLVYPVSIWIINNFIFLIFGFNRFNRIISFYELYRQLILGSNFLGVLWFLFSTIHITIIFIFVSFLFKSNSLYIFQILSIFVIFLEYLKIDTYILNYPFRTRVSVSYCLRQIPQAIFGFSFSTSKMVLNLKILRYPVFISFIHLLIIILIFKYEVFTYIGPYNGIEYIFSSFVFFIGFYILPLDKINPKICSLLKKVTSYTQGIFCLHTIIRFYVILIFDKQRSLSGAYITYIVSYLISFAGSKIFGKTKLRYLFV